VCLKGHGKGGEHKNLMIHVISEHIENKRYPSLYRSVDALVQASRGEGWGRPHQEAMSMSLPVIATNWSGTMAFMTETNSFLVPVQRMETLAVGPFKGHQWAIPSVVELRKILRAAVT